MASTVSSHNIFHIILVVLSKLVNLIIACFISSYMIVIGLILAKDVVKNIVSEQWFINLYQYIPSVPYDEEIEEFLFNLIGPWYKTAPIWWAVVVGFPLILSGLSVIIIGLTDFIYSITNAT